MGQGGWGLRFAVLFGKAVPDVRLWSRDRQHADLLARLRVNERHLPGIRVPESVRVSNVACEVAEGADLIVAAVPTSYLRATLTRLAPEIPAKTPVLSVVKGIEFGTFARPSQIIEETLGARPVAVLSGPSHAEELARGLPASVVVSGTFEPLCARSVMF